MVGAILTLRGIPIFRGFCTQKRGFERVLGGARFVASPQSHEVSRVAIGDRDSGLPLTRDCPIRYPARGKVHPCPSA